jgi:hypothetical protein
MAHMSADKDCGCDEKPAQYPDAREWKPVEKGDTTAKPENILQNGLERSINAAGDKIKEVGNKVDKFVESAKNAANPASWNWIIW